MRIRIVRLVPLPVQHKIWHGSVFDVVREVPDTEWQPGTCKVYIQGAAGLEVGLLPHEYEVLDETIPDGETNTDE